MPIGLLNPPPPPVRDELPNQLNQTPTGRGGFSRLRNQLDELDRAVDEQLARIEQKYTAIEARAQAAQAAVTQAAQTAANQLDQLTEGSATQLDDLLARLDGYDNAWTKLVKDAIAQMQEGILSGEEFLSKFGDFSITLGDKVLTIRELLEGMDLGTYEQRVQDLIQHLEENELSLQEIMARLQQSTSDYSKALANAIELFLQGKLTLEELLRQAERLRDVVGEDSEGGALAGELLEQLRGGNF